MKRRHRGLKIDIEDDDVCSEMLLTSDAVTGSSTSTSASRDQNFGCPSSAVFLPLTPVLPPPVFPLPIFSTPAERPLKKSRTKLEKGSLTSAPLTSAPLTSASLTSASLTSAPLEDRLTLKQSLPPPLSQSKSLQEYDEDRVVLQELKSGSKLFVFQLAEDLIRDVVLAGLTSAKTYSRHLPVTIWKRFSDIPTFQFFLDLSENNDIDVLESLHFSYPLFLNELSNVIKKEEGQVLFLTFVFRFCYTLLVKREVLVKWTPVIGFGLCSRKQVPENTTFQSCWGERVPITACETFFLTHQNLQQNLQLATSLVKTLDNMFAYFGPLSLINFSCKICNNVVLSDKLKPKSCIYPFAAFNGNEFQVMTTRKKVLADEELLCHYKPLTPLTCIAVSHHYLHSL
jgi:hypothetical protein